MFLPRNAEERLSALMMSFPAVVVSGARQVGKSTLLRHALRDAADFVVFDPVVDVENARRDPELLLDNHRTPLVLDELQYAPELLPSLKRRIDRDRSPGRDVLTGSQQWGALATVAESLAGRAALLDLDGFSLRESLEATAEKHWLDAALTGQELNRSQLGREIGVSPRSAERWLGILRATFQWFEVPAFSGNTGKRVASKAKGYVADTGFACHALAISTPNAVASHPAWGALFETAVYAEIRKAVSLMSPRPVVHHWRTGAGAEVDLLFERDGTFFPI